MKFILLILSIATLFLNINYVSTITIEDTIDINFIATNHGYLIGYFTFTGKGVAGLSYSISPFSNSSNFKLSIFPIAYDPYTNLKRISTYYFQSNCKEFYDRSIYTVNITKSFDRLPLGRFGGGFAVAAVLSDKYSCPPNLRHLDINEKTRSGIIKTKFEFFNPDENGFFTDHLTGSDRGVYFILQILLGLYIAAGLWTAYSVLASAAINVPLLLVIQKLVCVIIAMHIFIYILLLVAYHRLFVSGVRIKEVELAAELMALLIRYMEFYIVVSWTLSSQRDSGRNGNIVARVIGSCAVLHTILEAGHYCLLARERIDFSCSSIWDCEPHIYSMGSGNPIRYESTGIGWMLLGLDWITGLGASLFVLHLLKLGFGISEFSVRRAYVSVFCTASLLWFWSYPTIWFLSGLVTDIYQYKFVLFTVSVSHLFAIPAILRATILSRFHDDTSFPETVVTHN